MTDYNNELEERCIKLQEELENIKTVFSYIYKIEHTPDCHPSRIMNGSTIKLLLAFKTLEDSKKVLSILHKETN